MVSSLSNNSSLKLVLIDEDPIFRLALFTALQAETYRDIEVIAQGKIAATGKLLEQQIPDMLLLVVDLIRYPERLNSTSFLCQQLHGKYPKLIIFLITPLGTSETIEKIPGVSGCCPKEINIDTLVEALKICGGGNTYFTRINPPQSRKRTMGGWLYRQCKFGLEEVENNLTEISLYLRDNQLSLIDLWFWLGRKRELMAARWLIYQLLPSEHPPEIRKSGSSILEGDLSISTEITSRQKSLPNSAYVDNIYDLTLAKIKSSLANFSEMLLEIDILVEDKKQELLLIVLQEIKTGVEELKTIKIEPEALQERQKIFLKELWQNSSINFVSRYYSANKYSLVDLVLQEAATLEAGTLANIAFVGDLLAYLLFDSDLIIDSKIYKYHSAEAKDIEEILLQNLLLNIANAVMEFILNNFYEVESIRANLFDKNCKSSRKIAMFRNNLVWKYRRQKYWEIPKDIFEDRYSVLQLNYKGITKCKITHPRYQELQKLTGLPWAVTMAIEFRDSIARGVKAIGDIIGKSLVYILTEVIGKALGLIGKGIIQGIGNRIKN